MTLDRTLLTALPRPATEDEYGHAAAELEGLLIELPGAVAIHRYGSIAAPGISDLDRLVVIADRRPVRDVWSRLSERTRYLAMHTPVLVDSATFARHRWFTDVGTLELVWGHSLEVKRRPLPEYSEPLIAAEALVVTALKLAKLAVTGRVKVRPLLCELRNVRLDLGLAKLERRHAPRAWELVDEIDRLRDEWWSVTEPVRHARLRDVLRGAPDAVHEALRALGERVTKPGEWPQPIRLGAGWHNVTVVPGTGYDGRPTALTRIVARSRRLGEARWRWRPRSMALPPALVALLTGPPPPEYEDFRAERVALVRRYASVLTACPGYSAIGFAPVFLPG
jgi:hypothetical protein